MNITIIKSRTITTTNKWRITRLISLLPGNYFQKRTLDMIKKKIQTLSPQRDQQKTHSAKLVSLTCNLINSCTLTEKYKMNKGYTPSKLKGTHWKFKISEAERCQRNKKERSFKEPPVDRD